MIAKIQISKQNLIHNLNQFKSILNSDTKICCVVKGNAYGHGLEEVVECLKDEAELFAVANINELKRLRKITDKPVLILYYVSNADLEEAVKLDGTLCIFSEEQLLILESLGQKYKKKIGFHLTLDAALGREGFLPEEIIEIIAKVNKSRFLDLRGIYSHFANIEDTSDFSHAQKQIDIFESVLGQIDNDLKEKLIIHQSASSGILVYDQEKIEPVNQSVKKHRNNLVRLGVSLYGIWPSEELRSRFNGKRLVLKPVLKWSSQVAQIKSLPPGSSIGYGLTFITSKETKIAVIPQGYADGYDRGLSNIGEVLIGGKRCKVLGRVHMNEIVADISELEAIEIEEEVVLIGDQQGETITPYEIALKLGTIDYEIVTRISPLINREIF